MRLRLVIYILLIVVSGVSAQEFSYYSRYGFGEPQSSAFSNNKALGGIVAGYQDVFHINMTNPASYAKNTYVDFAFGSRFTTKTIENSNVEENVKAGDAQLDYIAIGFPIYKKPTYNDDFEVVSRTPKIGMALGLLPYYQSNYSQVVSLINEDSVSYDNLFNKNGQIYRLFAGMGAVVFEDSSNALTIGANANLIFGRLTQGEIILIPNDNNIFNTRLRNWFKVSGVAFDFGLQYTRHFTKWERQKNNSKKRNKELFITSGAYTHIPLEMPSTISSVIDRFRVINNISGNFDTLSAVVNEKVDVSFPATIGGGFTITRKDNSKSNRLLTGFDFSYTLWTQADQPLSNEATYRNAWKMNFGLEYSPYTGVNGNFFNTMNYRLGGYYDNGYLTIDNTDIKEFGITFGFAKPIIRKMAKQFQGKVILVPQAIAKLNFSFQVGQTGTTSNNLYRETFFRANIAVDLYGNWFIKAKYD